MKPDPKLVETLDVVARLAAGFTEPWWIIGSAAAVLVGLADQVADVDLLVSDGDARRLLEGQQFARAVPSPVFRSAVFGTLSSAPVPIEVMAGLLVRGEPLVPETRLSVPWRDSSLYVPEPAEQVAILEQFGREKDLSRAERLRSLSSAGDRSRSL